MYDQSQLMKGIMEGCIFSIIGRERTYGYEIVERLREKGFSDVREGTIYPLLLRLEKKGMLRAEFMPSPLGPSRKYYSLTEEGRRQLEVFCDSWRRTARAVERTIGEEGENNDGQYKGAKEGKKAGDGGYGSGGQENSVPDPGIL